MLIVLPILALMLLVLAVYATFPEWGWRRLILRTGILWAVFASLLIELLSLLRAVTEITLGIAWFTILVLAGTVAYRNRSNLRKASGEVRKWLPRDLSPILIALIVLVFTATALVAWFTPPQTWNSLTYHMARVAHLAQNRSIMPYVTGIEWQNGNSPGSETQILHTYILGGGDQWANFIEWLAMVGSVQT